MPTPGRGAQRFFKILEALKCSSYTSAATDLNSLLKKAMPVDPGRISLSDRAGLVDPADVLKGGR